MSYEGYDQSICSNHHYYERDVYDEDQCPVCGASAEWFNPVDETNCYAVGIILTEDLEKFRTSADTFRFPSPEETAEMRSYLVSWPTDGEPVYARLKNLRPMHER